MEENEKYLNYLHSIKVRRDKKFEEIPAEEFEKSFKEYGMPEMNYSTPGVSERMVQDNPMMFPEGPGPGDEYSGRKQLSQIAEMMQPGPEDMIPAVGMSKKVTKGIEEMIRDLIPKGRKLDDYMEIGAHVKNPDFFIKRKGSEDSVGKVVKDGIPGEDIGIKIISTDLLNPKFMEYAFMNLHNQGWYKAGRNYGTLSLKNIRKKDVQNLDLEEMAPFFKKKREEAEQWLRDMPGNTRALHEGQEEALDKLGKK